jgi:ribosomal protein L37AE/L43A
MSWEYHELPEPLRVPPCPKCRNRLWVRQIVASIFLCTECQPAYVFHAVWREEAKTVRSTSALKSSTPSTASNLGAR